jgi:predicted transcriptional regulator
VRSGLRDLTEAGYLREEGGRYLLTDSGKEALRKAGVVV